MKSTLLVVVMMTMLMVNTGYALDYPWDKDKKPETQKDISPQPEISSKKTSGKNEAQAKRHYDEGLIYNEQKRYPEAIAAFGKAIELKPDYADAYHSRGNSYIYKKEYGRAIQDYTKVTELKPDDAAAYYNRGAAKEAIGDFSGALKDWEQSLDIEANDEVVRWIEVLREKIMEKFNEAISDYSEFWR